MVDKKIVFKNILWGLITFISVGMAGMLVWTIISPNIDYDRDIGSYCQEFQEFNKGEKVLYEISR